jgi:uncharacterized protein YkwD
LALLAWAPKQQRAVVILMGAAGPVADLRVSQPKLVWQVWANGEDKVTACSMTLNGEKVAARYDAESHEVVFEPDKPLSPGKYQASALATVENVLTRSTAWSFSVRPDATPTPPAPAQEQRAAVDSLNTIRSGANLPPMRLDPGLCAAAQAHARYMAANRLLSHEEATGHGSYLGQSAEIRAGAYGFVGSLFECVAFATDQPTAKTVQDTFDAPYHRIGLLQPEKVDVGIGTEKGFVDIASSSRSTAKLVVSPSDGQTIPKGAWEANEEPNPLVVHGSKVGSTVGYPIVLASFDQARHIQHLAVKLTGPNGEVPSYLNTPENDGHLTDAAILIPKAPLKAGRYSVTGNVTYDDGKSTAVTSNFNVKA